KTPATAGVLLANVESRVNGKTIRQEIAAARIGEIKKRLMSSQNTISEIARSCGFSGAPALSRYFMRETGERPSVWRAR
ncbi:MAG: helix-turn-helix domain-containing protein, partial [Kiritimatiellia bacterium]